MSLLSKAGVAVLTVFVGIVTLGVGFLVWQHRAEARRIAENYGEKYIEMLKHYAKTSKKIG